MRLKPRKTRPGNMVGMILDPANMTRSGVLQVQTLTQYSGLGTNPPLQPGNPEPLLPLIEFPIPAEAQKKSESDRHSRTLENNQW
jgi:hypothetical protein